MLSSMLPHHGIAEALLSSCGIQHSPGFLLGRLLNEASSRQVPCFACLSSGNPLMCVMASQPAPAPLVLSLKAATLSDNAQCVTPWQ